MASPKPLAGLEKIAPYVGGESEITGVERVIKLASNEGAFGPSPKALEALSAAASEYHRYPDGDATELRRALAAKHGLNFDNIICGSGSDELISLLCRSYAGPGDEILYSAHGFAMFPIYGLTVGADVVATPEKDITIDVDALLEHASDKTRIVFIANPNNPTGTYIPASEVERLRDGLRDDILLVLDGAYTEFVDRTEGKTGRRDRPHVHSPEQATGRKEPHSFQPDGWEAAKFYGPGDFQQAGCPAISCNVGKPRHRRQDRNSTLHGLPARSKREPF